MADAYPELSEKLDYWIGWSPETPPISSLNVAIVALAKECKAEIARLRAGLERINEMDENYYGDDGMPWAMGMVAYDTLHPDRTGRCDSGSLAER